MSYRQILGLTGHSFDWFTTDLKLYKDGKDSLEQLILANEDFREITKEARANNFEVDRNLLKIPENIFIVNSHQGNIWYVLTNKQTSNQDSPVYFFENEIAEDYSSVWGWITDCVVNLSTYAY